MSRYDGEADYSAAVLQTFERFKQGTARDYRIRYRTDPGMNHVAAQITELVSRLFPEEFGAQETYCREHDGFLDEAIARADSELQFYLAYLDYIAPVRAAGLGFCYPEVSATAKETQVADAFDLALARKLTARRQPVVTNDFRLDGPERIFVVTGPNQGGKTTFARTFGQLHHLAAVGCPVPGRTARLFLPDRIFTHFIREEDADMTSGRLDDELKRMSATAGRIGPHALMLFNESFAGTNEHEGSEIGYQVVRALLDDHVRVFFVTHRYEFADRFRREHPDDTLFLRADRRPDGSRAYKLTVNDPRPTSYGEDLYRRLGGWPEEDRPGAGPG